MASCLSVINLALSKIGVGGGAKPARAADLQTGLTTLQSLYRELIASGRLGKARPVAPTGDYTARENDRILRGPECTSVTLPRTVVDRQSWGSEWDMFSWGGEYESYYDCPNTEHTRLPRDGCFVIIKDEVSDNLADYIYDGYCSSWISVFDLSLQEYQEITDANGNVIEILQPSIAPLSMRDTNGLAALLAMRLCDHFGQSPSPMTQKDAIEYEGTLVLGWGEPEQHPVRKEWF